MTTPEQLEPTPESQDLAAAQALLALASSIDAKPVGDSGLASLFAGVGPSDTFMATRLTDAGVSQEELDRIKTKINDAIANKDMATINTIAKYAVSVLGGVRDILL